jgi:hypothetical protein
MDKDLVGTVPLRTELCANGVALFLSEIGRPPNIKSDSSKASIQLAAIAEKTLSGQFVLDNIIAELSQWSSQ